MDKIETTKSDLAATEHLISCLENGEKCSIQVGEEKLFLPYMEAAEMLRFLHSRFAMNLQYYITHST